MGKAETSDSKAGVRSEVSERLGGVVRRARLALFWEAFWPRLVPLLSLVGLFVILSWFGLWSGVADLVRAGILALFGLGFLFCLMRVLRTPWPDEAAALRRVERASDVPHRPASGLRDNLSAVSDGPAATALWAAHQSRLLASLSRLKAGWAHPDMARRDPNAWRFAVPVLLAVAFFAGWGEHWPRLVDAFRPVSTELVATAPARIDAWIDPPAYTGAPPVYLSRREGAVDGGEATSGEPVSVPQGSKLTIRVVSREAPQVSLDTAGEVSMLSSDAAEAAGEAPAAQGEKAKAAPKAADAIRSYSAILETDGSVAIAAGSSGARYAFRIIPDRPPTISRGAVKVNRSGSFSMEFTVDDDYGVTGGSVTFRPKNEQEDGARPLVETPTVPIRIARSRDKEKEASGKAYARLEEHPFAGMEVLADAVVTDAAGQEGRPPDDGTMTLPERPFRNPVARALIEQRRDLALDARRQSRVASVLDAMMLRPDRFIQDSSIYLGLSVAYHRLRGAETDDQLRDVLAYLWDMAVLIEDGELSAAQQRLAEAREALENALAEGASEEEIARLTEELRQAMNEFMRSMAEQMARMPQQQLMPIDPNAQMMSQQDLDRMLDRIEDLARLGENDAAQELLSQLQEMLDNMQMAQRMQQQMQSGEMGEMMQQMEELGRLMREQQKLMDDTFRLDQGQRPTQRGQQGQQGQQGELSPSEMAEIMRQLQEGQGDLHQGLQALLDQLQQMQQGGQGENGQQPGQPGAGQQEGPGQGERALDRAGRAMGDAAGSLGQGETRQAYGQQGEALQAMREGMQSMMNEMLGQQGQGGQQRMGRGGMPRGQVDPLGRPQRTDGPDLGQNVRVPDEIDVERARRILNAIRERLGERFRPPYELQYLERLLNRD
ncbi:TIGR02302 family protein [Afifella sp. IM 167]|uniref:TIGR02302 family protein n=1 Tax=Afifella sp. IM 167 TaxID=2033586 RepID=UPI001CCEBFAC